MKTYRTACFVYVLKDPRTNAVRYIGVTCKPTRRLRGHVQEAGRTDTYKSRWIRQLLRLKLIPVLVVVENIKANADWAAREIWWIARGIKLGWRLTNATTGGDGVPNYIFTDAVRAKMSQSLKGHSVSAATRLQIGRANAGRVRSEQLKRQISAKAKARWTNLDFRKHMSEVRKGQKRKPLSEATRRKISESQKGKVLSVEHRAKLSAAHTGKKLSLAARQKVSDSLRGHTMTKEGKAKVGAKTKLRWEDPAYRRRMSKLIKKGMQKTRNEHR
jgi:hypothetical protein